MWTCRLAEGDQLATRVVSRGWCSSVDSGCAERVDRVVVGSTNDVVALVLVFEEGDLSLIVHVEADCYAAFDLVLMHLHSGVFDFDCIAF